MNRIVLYSAALLGLLSLPALAQQARVPTVVAPAKSSGEFDFTGPSPWRDIRQQRIRTLLPAAMKTANVDAWLTLVRENANDPLALHVGGENAGALSAILYLREGDGVRSVILAGFGEVIALRELAVHDSVIAYTAESGGPLGGAAERLLKAKAARIAINSGNIAMADGLSASQRAALERALGPELSARLVSSGELVSAWLSVKVPDETAIMRRAAALTAQLELEAYATVVPGKTRDSDIARFLKRRMRELGVEDGWSPAQNPSVNSGPDRGHSHASDRVIQQGDVIQIDFGIKVFGVWGTDIQRFAYVQREGATSIPADVQRKWDAAVRGNRAAFQSMRPGVPGSTVDSAQRVLMQRDGSATVPWGTGHSVGYWAHDVGPGLNRSSRRPLEKGMTFAFDGFHAWTLPGGDGTWGNGSKTISVEEMAVITETGAAYLTPPQDQLIVIGAKGGLVGPRM
ncbi:MAG: aminopeptidase P family protein [Phycisphaerae bacterium]|nr:aminopeptidase P family protein [Gemmatimonadaceae bacterium]